MKKIKLNKDAGKTTIAHGFELDPKEEYIIDVSKELEFQMSIYSAISVFGLSAMTDYHNWLEANGFDSVFPNPTNEFVSTFYGKKALWETKLSRGIVVKNSEDDDYYIVIECSRLNHGFQYTQIIATLGGCY